MIEPSVGVNPVMPGWPGFVSAVPNGFLSQTVAPTAEPLTVAEAMAHLRLDDTDGELAPSAVTAALAGAGAGNVENGVHRYLATFVTADGETDAGAVSAALTVVDKTANGKVTLTNIPVGGSAVTARNLYRTVAGGSTYLKLAQLADNTTTAYTDNIADASLGVQAPTANTTSNPYVLSLIQMARMWAEQETSRAFLTQTFVLYLDSFPWWRAPIWIPNPPCASVTHVKYYDADGVLQTWSASNYTLVAPAGPTAQRAQIVPAAGVSYPLLPSSALTQRRPDGVQVTFVCGWTSAALVPAPIKAAMKLMIANLYRNREAVQAQGAIALPFGCDALLAPYRVMVY